MGGRTKRSMSRISGVCFNFSFGSSCHSDYCSSHCSVLLSYINTNYITFLLSSLFHQVAFLSTGLMSGALTWRFASKHAMVCSPPSFFLYLPLPVLGFNSVHSGGQKSAWIKDTDFEIGIHYDCTMREDDYQYCLYYRLRRNWFHIHNNGLS